MSQPLISEELTKLFQAIVDEPTGKLSELAKVAGLNLSEDYIGADLSGEDLSRDNLSHANLSGANLHNANLRETNLNRANLSGANLSGANLYKTNFNRANLQDADLSNTDLSVATWSNTKWIDKNRDTNLENKEALDMFNFSESSRNRFKMNLTRLIFRLFPETSG
ncbi:pentapeptide repeat-containing protein [Aetokthonos hydrillicola Thurmond2011]|jgi:uncharacterized protein YjbI with pentapeptide repeats|uniref:Pentapeptide repeat-containing protein n=1 Tax=Aetokthonos hydrillicola Thurmond2011 TaxID=2712845 RepID=A0AAP5I3D0_9CYAN|nr:pentapeptide repeat-containing protein [Aetokthonos hydrillicola]MBO3460151.1 pentapeptide repeat-containing protein [Aetokthonos hydrillicola CCALA 1050]MBW4590478.1 pentapeptide repeat-containing protein [Aetokthonos hydrillicola CCALA 1050]MDR9893007.1 pentapeptide repeat-containing protein [Aetokthonos hydrillicola Thurmond2011]